MTVTTQTFTDQPDNAWVRDCLRYGDLAIALYAAGLPDGHLEVDELAALAAAGVQRMGGIHHVRQVCDHWNALNTRWMRGDVGTDDYENELRSLLPRDVHDPHLLNRCIGYDIGRFRL